MTLLEWARLEPEDSRHIVYSIKRGDKVVSSFDDTHTVSGALLECMRGLRIVKLVEGDTLVSISLAISAREYNRYREELERLTFFKEV